MCLERNFFFRPEDFTFCALQELMFWLLLCKIILIWKHLHRNLGILKKKLTNQIFACVHSACHMHIKIDMTKSCYYIL